MWLISNFPFPARFASPSFKTAKYWFYQADNTPGDSNHAKHWKIQIHHLVNSDNQIFGARFNELLDSGLSLHSIDPDDTPFIVCGDNGFLIVNDQFGFYKYFVYASKDLFLISDNLSTLLGLISPEVDSTAIAIYTLSYHYLCAKTLFKDVSLSQPGSVISLDNGSLKSDKYWSATHLLAPIDKDIDAPAIARILRDRIEKHINKTNSDQVSLSLTGGIDSRILLSILIKLGVQVHTYTYGDVQAIDCRIASRIAKDFKLQHRVYDINFDKRSFTTAAEKSLQLGSSICSIHRAHRLEAISRESEYAQVMLLGTMGGEFVKGANHDDYIIADFVYEYAQNNHIETILTSMKKRGFFPDEHIAVKVKKLFDEQLFIADKDNMELHALTEISASLHHGQNQIQYSHYFNDVWAPFCDTEYLQLFFSSRFNIAYRRNKQHGWVFKRDNPNYGCSMQSCIDTKLARIPYSGGFSAKEYLVSPYYAAALAKIRNSKATPPPTFALKEWMFSFAKEMLLEIKRDNGIISNIFDVSGLLFELQRPGLPVTENFWIRFTIPIQMYMSMKTYGLIK